MHKKTLMKIFNFSKRLLYTSKRKDWSVYGMSKAGIDMLTKCLAMELGPKGIRVNCVK
jgi:NAD(P)-dependent dehydrogenase (short-subunit alcohol dehydrogenase family)